MKPITFEEILAELERLEAEPNIGDEELSTVDWAEQWGVGRDTARRLLKKAALSGLLTSRNVRMPCPLRPGYKSVVTVHRFVSKGSSARKAAKKKR